MSEFESLERELAEMRPRQPSVELKARIADRLSSPAPRFAPAVVTRRVRMRFAIGGALVAASLATIVFWWGRVPRVASDPQTMPVESLLATPLDRGAPSAWTYRSALVHSPVSVESLLDQHSVKGRAAKSVGLSVNAFARLDSDKNELFGEL
jgi:hypothetical protein